MKSFLCTAVAVLSLFCGAAQAATCGNITTGADVKLAIRPDNLYMNCYAVQDSATLSKLNVVSTSVGRIPHKVRIFDIQADGSLVLAAEAAANSIGVATISFPVNGRRLLLSIVPTDGSKTAVRNVNIAFYAKDGSGAVAISVENDAVAAQAVNNGSTTPSQPIPPNCDIHGFCTQPEVVSPGTSRVASRLAVTAAVAEPPPCDATNKGPEQNNKGPKKFDLNKAMAMAKSLNLFWSTYLGRAEAQLSSALWMYNMFKPGAVWDLKQNPDYMVAQEYGNFVYGAVAAEAGYTLAASLTAGAVVQQYQNYTNPNNPNYADPNLLMQNFIVSSISGLGDNPDDPPMITAGYRYAKDIYDKDPDPSRYLNSCDKTPAPATVVGSNGDFSYGGGWTVNYSFLGSGGCIGNCSWGVPEVTVGPVAPAAVANWLKLDQY